MAACGLDFGTSNSAIGVLRGNELALAPVEGASTLIPSAVFFDYESRGRIAFGADAIGSDVAEIEGRLMRALKSILGSPLIHETTRLGDRNVPLTEVVEIFIRHLKRKAEEFAGEELTSVIHGRPVHFVGGDDEADEKAESVLEGIARRVGFRDVAFVYEPIAAAYHYEATASREEIVLIADIGGGTSDFTVIRTGPERRGRVDRADDILANAGLRIGGTDFDALFSRDSVMPLLGMGTFLIEKNLPMPISLYLELASWATINFTYTNRNERVLTQLVADAREPDKVGRLLTVLRQHFGHRIAAQVEAAKIELSDHAKFDIPLAFIDGSLHAPATRKRFDSIIRATVDKLTRGASDCIRAAGIRPDQLHTIFFTGGSTRIPAVRKAISRAAPEALAAAGSDFVSVALGLTREAARRFG